MQQLALPLQSHPPFSLPLLLDPACLKWVNLCHTSVYCTFNFNLLPATQFSFAFIVILRHIFRAGIVALHIPLCLSEPFHYQSAHFSIHVSF